ncbi:MAG: heme biosynthesis protein HemY, partial [Beijerinckiaceae bacterium]
LEAQAAQLAGDREKARTAFQAMTRERDTTILGLRGLYVEAQRAGDADAARAAASEAVAVAPSAAWANEALLMDRFAARDWQGARVALERAERLRVLDKSTSKRHRAVLLTAEALDILGAQPTEALKKAQEAAGLAPDLVPAVALAGRLLGEKGELRKATKLIETAWRAGPHPDLADAYVHVRPGDSTHDRLQRAEMLAKLAPRDPESALTIAQAALAARDTARARAALEPVLAARPTIRACTLMAEIEDQDGHPGLAKGWLARLPRVARDKAWVADGHVSRFWSPVSPVTGRLDAFVWTDPPQDAVAAIGPPDEDLTALPAVIDDSPLLPPAIEPSQGEAREAVAEAMNDSSQVSTSGVAHTTSQDQTPVDVRLESKAEAGTSAPSSQSAAPSAVTLPVQGKEEPPLSRAANAGHAAGQPVPVVFPIPHAPDDPGPDANGTAPRRWRVFGG